MMKLKNEADVAIAKPRQFVIAHRRNLGVPDANRAAIRPIESAEKMQQRRFADAGRTYDRQHLALTYGEFEVAQYRHRNFSVAIRLRKRPRFKKGHQAVILICGHLPFSGTATPRSGQRADPTPRGREPPHPARPEK